MHISAPLLMLAVEKKAFRYREVCFTLASTLFGWDLPYLLCGARLLVAWLPACAGLEALLHMQVKGINIFD